MKLKSLLLICTGLWCCSKINSKTNIVASDSVMTEPISYYALSLDEYKTLYELKSYVSEIDSTKAETLNFDCAILIYPTDGQMEEGRNTLGEHFREVVDENNVHHEMAMRLIDSVAIKKNKTKAQCLRLKGKNATWDLDIRKNDLPDWNLILFKRTKEPAIIPVASLTVDRLKDYFEIK